MVKAGPVGFCVKDGLGEICVSEAGHACPGQSVTHERSQGEGRASK